MLDTKEAEALYTEFEVFAVEVLGSPAASLLRGRDKDESGVFGYVHGGDNTPDAVVTLAFIAFCAAKGFKNYPTNGY